MMNARADANVRAARPPGRATRRIGVIGAGIAGAIAARTLHDRGMPVTVLDKARGPGGRMSTRRTGEGLRFNHGAQYFTVRDERFGRLVRSWLRDGLVQRWEPRELRIGLDGGRREIRQHSKARFVARPGMNALARRLLADVDARFGTRVVGLRWEGDAEGWRLAIEGEDEALRFDALIVTAPASQTAELLDGDAPALAKRVRQARLLPCWAMMIAFENDLEIPYDAISAKGDGPVAWAARQTAAENAAERSARSPDAWVVHASSAWSQARLNEDDHVVRDGMLSELARIVDRPLPQIRTAMMHRWRYALVDEAVGEAALWDAERRIAAAGDWCIAGRVESAFLSGCAAADCVLAAANITNDRGANEHPGEPRSSREH
jgi:hypothetical protein